MGALKNRLHRLAVGKKQLGFPQFADSAEQAFLALPFRLDQVPEIAVEIDKGSSA
ncbi:hypothetical protein [Mesorhizobium sp. B1-1-8]|uniref:hypothetical protein n=1 Tax=Mesorhizobium sp. B1-1-8 TaxID=2589976 RepID=UPI0015E306A7|nr:hypothetical protein [Mesorhizobium sp. B1-1-8]UCI08673.1 hypothetical protein FJ974_06275 [Mesorhizobium sp. B1-1-8]